MNAEEQLRASRTKSTFDPGPTIQQIDQELRELSDSTVERYARDLDLAEVGAKRWEALDEYSKKAMRASNELARRQRVKEQQAAKAAEDAKDEARQNARVEQQIADYKAKARGAWIGDQASFDAAFPELLRQWQIDHVRATMDRNMAEVRARMVDF